jgi:uncharacterized protein (DUF362 family)
MAFNRRDFFKYLAGLTIAPPGLFSTSALFGKKIPLKKIEGAFGRVVIVKRPEVFKSPGIVSSEVIYQMLGNSICRLTGRKTPSQAWSSLFSSSERIGIKINALGGRRICTHPEVVYAVTKHLTESGIPSGNIIIWDRLTSELKKGGYKIQNGGGSVQCFGTDSDYELSPEFYGSIGSCFSRILTRKCDALISIPVLKDHDLSGVSLSLKNFYGSIHNPNKYHDNGCDPFIADVNSHPHIKNKLRLVIIDGLTAQCNGGPAFKPQWSWPYSGLVLSQDPVAADRVGTDIIENQRKIEGLSPLKQTGRAPIHIQTAAKNGLGVGDLQQIEKIVI